MRKWLLVGACVGALTASAATAATAVGAEHVFDPVLSLTGNCSESGIDPIPDPGPCPGETGIDHPSAPFNTPKAVTTDSYGNIYVASTGPEAALGVQGRIVIFDSSGHFITEVKDESGPNILAVDGDGVLYVANAFSALDESLVRYEPTTYEPATGEIEYDDPPVVLAEAEASGNGLAINSANGHLFRKRFDQIVEYGSAAEGNPELGVIADGQLQSGGPGLAIDQSRGRIYAATWEGPPENIVRLIKAFDLAAPHNLLFTIEESDIPGGKILSSFMGLAVDEGTGHSFLYDGNAKKVYEFDEDGAYVSTIEFPFQATFLSQIGIDNGPNSPNGGLNPFGRYLYVPSHPAGVGHSFAFGPESIGAPVVKSVTYGNVGETEAELRASIEPFGLLTDYTFEYITQQQYEEQGNSFAGAQTVEGQIAAGNAPVTVVAPANDLQPGTAYRFRVFAQNDEGDDEAEGELSTYPSYGSLPPCPNDPLRTGPSALLPDCRAYELVTPPDTNARAPHGVSHLGIFFPTREASPDGSHVSFQIEGGTIPGHEGTGSLGGDNYLSTRDSSGWNTSIAGPSGSEAAAPVPGSTSPDQGYALWSTGGGEGSAEIEDGATTYVHYPDGHSALVGRGEIADDPRAAGRLIAENGSHIIFETGVNDPAVRLEEDAPPDGTRTIYDRTADEDTHVVSLLPGGATPATDAVYTGASLDGRGVAFEIGDTLYLRYDNEETYEIGDDITFAGIAEGGNRIFYVEAGNLHRFDSGTQATTPFSTTGDITPVNVSADGTVAYFTSPTALAEEVNPNGAVPVAGEENLYRSEEGDVDFVGTVTERDVAGASGGNDKVGGLGLWTEAVRFGRPAKDPSRTTADGGVLLFESRASLDGYDPEDHAQVYRYDSVANELDCLSCNPTGAPASSDASLQSISQGLGDLEPFSSFGYVANLAPDGHRAFFQSNEALVADDSDGLQDVYEWEAQGIGSCATPGGCIYLISSGHSLRLDYLYAVSDSGDDAFIRTSDILLPRDAEETPSIYDARVGGGFAEPVEQECVGEGCRPGLTPAPPLALPAAPSLGAKDNVVPKKGKRCGKGKRKVRQGGKVRCVKKKAKHQRRAGAGKKGAAR